jgi:fatty acid desaturase
MHAHKEPWSTTRRILAVLGLFAAGAILFWTAFGDSPEWASSAALAGVLLFLGGDELRKSPARTEKRIAIALVVFGLLMAIGALVELL